MRTYADATAIRLAELCGQYLGRSPLGLASDTETGAPVLDFDPPLSADEQTTYDLLLALARAETARLTLTRRSANSSKCFVPCASSGVTRS